MLKKLCPSFLFALLTAAVGVTELCAEDAWKPAFEKEETVTQRKLEWFTNDSDPAWKAVNPEQSDSFAVLHPKTGDAEGLPLYVVLHSAGHDVRSCIECTKTKGNHDIYHAPDSFYALYVDCAANRIDWWWGGLSAHEAPNSGNAYKAGRELTPCEKRVTATVAWTIRTYKIDPNRVYLCGNSMGGSGTLGIGLRHGDVFAAVKANVPAGVKHAACRMYFTDDDCETLLPSAKVPYAALPEPPICIDYSAPNDGWSEGHEILFAGMKRDHYALIAYWGNFGHANNNEKICEINDLINTFDWLSVRKNAAYPVFTNAACDDPIPWPDREKSTKPGQMNAFFRWENVSDSARKLELNLYLIPNNALQSRFFQSPESTTADVSLRRLQNLKIRPNQSVKWTFGKQSGTVRADENGLLTIPGLVIQQKKTTLKINVQ